MTRRRGTGTVCTVTPTTPPPPPASWWAPGLALHERGTPDTGDATSSELAEPFASRVADLGLTTAAVAALRSEPADRLAARVAAPEWVRTADRAMRAERPRPTDTDLDGTWREAFGLVVRPFVDDARNRVTEAGRAVCADLVDLAAVADAAARVLTDKLVDLAARALVAELHRMLGTGELSGDTGRTRFHAFVRSAACPPGLTALLTRFPVLARVLAQATNALADSTAEILARFDRDRADIVTHLLDGADPGALVGLALGQGDPHHGGRTVATLTFADGRRVVYKPRDLTSQVRFGDFLRWLETAAPGLAPMPVRAVTRTGYGWSEHIADQPAADRAAVERFYRRLGALLALLHAIRATDVHLENVIAHGEHPVLVDTETLFHPDLGAGTGDPAADALAVSVHRTALLPLIVVGEAGIADVSGFGGGAPGGAGTAVDWLDPGTDRMRLTRRPVSHQGTGNRPILDGAPVDPGEHEAAMVAGFRQAYTAIRAGRADFTALAESCAELPIRVVTRPTWVYSTLLDETTHPDVLGDALDRDEALAILGAGRVGDPLFGQFPAAEIAAMWDGDIPLFTGTAGGTVLRTAAGRALEVGVARSGLRSAVDTVSRFDTVDRRDQEWIISATLATRRAGPAHPRAEALSVPPTGTAPHPDGLLAAACAVADQIVARGIPGRQRTNWLGLESVDERQWLVLPMGIGLGHGYLGVAVFLAQLAATSGISRYAEQARRAVCDAPALVDALVGRPDVAAAIGCGGLNGLGGIGYGLARLGALLDDQRLTDAAARVFTMDLDTAAGAELGWADGLAGWVAARAATGAALGLPDDHGLADHLAARAEAEAHALPATFARGVAGIAWALRAHPAGARLSELAARGVPDGSGWCDGVAGLLPAYACLPGAAGADLLAATDRPLRRDLSLCHGELGVLESLSTLTDDRESPAARVLRKRSGLVLDVLHRHGPLSGTPDEVGTPGLLTGLAGIGYGLLRLAAPHDIPSILLLQPTKTAPITRRRNRVARPDRVQQPG